MQFSFTEEQHALRRAARSFLEVHSSSEAVRRAMQSEAGFDREIWLRVASELGWPALLFPEEYGGAGGGFVELVAIAEELGRALFCGPFFSSICLFGNALLLAGSDAQKKQILPRIVTAEITAALAHAEPSGAWDAAGVKACWQRAGGELVLSGQKSYVVDGHVADLLLVAARAPGSTGEAGISLFLVDPRAPGVTRRALPALDSTRRFAAIELAGVRVPEHSLVGREGEGWAILERTLHLASIALAAEQVGGAERCLEMSVDYAKLRVQFGRPIGSFQAIKHKCADMFLMVESARSACYYAAWAAASAVDEVPTAALQAKAYCSEAYLHVASETIQIHGGVGFTWEHDAHLHFKRAKASEILLGDASYHRERYARCIGL